MLNFSLFFSSFQLKHNVVFTQTGASGIPAALVQRYADELHSDLCSVAEVLEAERIKCLLQQGRTVVSASIVLIIKSCHRI